MRKICLALFVIALTQFYAGCAKAEKDIVDCLGESLLAQVHFTADEANAKLINLHVNYSGRYTVQSVEWQFGDGATATVSATASIAHTYAAAGAYTVKAKVNIKADNHTCTLEPSRTVTVN